MTHGVGTQGEGLTAKEASIGLRTWWLCEILYAPVSLAVRTSVAVFLLQIAVQRLHRRIIVAVMAAFWIATIPLFFVALFQCRPVSYFWTQPLPDAPRGMCMDPHVIFAVSIVHSATSACCDWTLGTLPMFMLWNVRLNTRTKLTLSVLLSMGILCVILHRLPGYLHRRPATMLTGGRSAGIALTVRVAYVRPFDVSVNFLFETL